MIELTCWPLDNKAYTSAALGAAYAARSRGLLHSSDFAASTNGDNTLTLSKGVGCVHVSDFWAAFPFSLNDTLLQFDDADGVYPRIDVVVLGCDKNANTAGLYVRAGLPAEAPERPALRRDSDFDELFLYEVRRPAGAVKISAEQITDLRLDGPVCGLMRDTIDAIDTGVMQAQFEAMLARIDAELSRLNAGTETMLRTEYDPAGLGADLGIQLYTHSKNGTVHNFVGTGMNGRAKITADFVDGDTFAVNGSAVNAYVGADTPDGDTIVSGRWVQFIFDGTQLNFKGGGGLSNSKLALATATESQVRAGYSIYAGDKKLKYGNIKDKAGESKTLSPGSTYTFATADKYCTGNMIINVNSPSGSLTKQFDTNHDNWTDNRKSRARLNINVSVSGNTVRVYGYVYSWIEGLSGGGDFSQNYDYTFYTY